jgi:hypothetical protein
MHLGAVLLAGAGLCAVLDGAQAAALATERWVGVRPLGRSAVLSRRGEA